MESHPGATCSDILFIFREFEYFYSDFVCIAPVQGPLRGLEGGEELNKLLPLLGGEEGLEGGEDLLEHLGHGAEELGHHGLLHPLPGRFHQSETHMQCSVV